MEQTVVRLVLIVFILSVSARSMAQQRAGVFVPERDTVTRGKYTLVVLNDAIDFDTVTRRRMIDAFFDVYPREADRFNKNTLKQVTFFIDPRYEGVAATGGGVARFNPAWFKEHPEDIDVVTHEVMHIVQDYRNYEPSWLTEGIADYSRYVFGINNLKGDWKLYDYMPGQSYKNAYRVTARFLVWAEAKRNKHLTDRLDAAMRAGTYDGALWVKLTGETVDQLWSDYSKDPAVSLTYR
jgi:hypothetical protein